MDANDRVRASGSDADSPAHAVACAVYDLLGVGRPAGWAQIRSAAENRRMKVLLISLYHPELVRGGAQQICYELFNGLKTRDGIQPVFLAGVDPSFKSLYKSGAQITGFDGREGEFLYLSRDYDYVWQKSSSLALARSFAEFLKIVQPDVVHF